MIKKKIRYWAVHFISDYIEKRQKRFDVNSYMYEAYEKVISDINESYEENVFVIGSLSQSSQIKEIAKGYIHAKYVYPQPSKSFKQLVSEAFDNIEKADIIIVLKKPDGSIGQGVTYEIEYAKRLNKKIIFMDSVQ